MSGARRLGRAEVRRLLEEHGISPSKSLGQHFVADPNTVERIARLAGVGPGDRVVEVGPGLGSLTLALAATGASVLAVEVDRRLVPVLRSLVPGSVRVVEADARSVDWGALLGDAPGWSLVANLPYNVATPLVLDVLARVPPVTRLLVMVQREVAERMAAVPGTKAYGAVSVRVAYFATARLAGLVSPEVFHPRPNVESALVSIERRDRPAVDPAVASFPEIDELVRAGFAGRRKMLRRSLAELVDAEVFERSGIPPTARAEELDVVAWGTLAGCRRSDTRGRSRS
ncbi:MAG: 16S rRNA (adenine(1518)-N(6)/adenine(1519)-N(6))-dimethyltransferase RsmA [Actinomycetota bacterium]|nr:16S rRNA (adenine(1518)-N(6)/adenine(1519)-N(6))-dimethyltransferase RsmA [Actinomycetota bacterium]